MFPLCKVVSLGALTLLLSACQSTQVVRQSDVSIPMTFNENQAAKGSPEISRWWQQWQDPLLSSLIEQGLQDSPDIRIAESRFAEAGAISRLANADLGPQVGVNASAGIIDGSAHLSANENLSNLLGASTALLETRQDLDSSHANVGFAAAWEPDIFGKKQSDADAARYAALGVQEKVHGAQMLLADQIADHYFQARAAQQREVITARNIDILTRFERYVQGRFQAGQVTMYEVNNIQSKLNAMRAKKSTINAEYATHVRSIAVLIGQVPQSFVLPSTNIDILSHQPSAPSGQTPQGLLERRPDLRAYGAQVNAYSAKLASAKADLLPRFSIRFLGQGGRIDVDSDVPDLKGWGSILSVGINVPIFTNGRIEANIESADARLQTALLQYDRSLLRALSEVDNTYQAHQALQQQQILLNKAYRQSVKRATDAEKLFRYGYQTLDEALTAQLDSEQIQENLVQSQLARAQMLLNLYKSLGGGWVEHTTVKAS